MRDLSDEGQNGPTKGVCRRTNRRAPAARSGPVPMVTQSGRSELRPIRHTPLALLHKPLYAFVEAEGERLTGRIELPQGTLDLLILRTLLPGAQHGWAISERVQQVSSEALSIQQGSLYPALHRLERRGWIKARWGISDNNRRAKYYELTSTGKRQLEAETQAWHKLTVAVQQVLEGA